MRKVDKTKKRASITDAAFIAFARRGVDRATLMDVAKEAGISAGLICWYFESKDQLEDATFKVLVERRARFFEKYTEGSQPAREKIKGLFHAMLADYKKPDSMAYMRFELAAGLIRHARFREMFLEQDRLCVAMVAQVVQEGVKGGEFAANTDARKVARTLMALLDGFWTQWTDIGSAAEFEALVMDSMQRCLSMYLKA